MLTVAIRLFAVLENWLLGKHSADWDSLGNVEGIASRYATQFLDLKFEGAVRMKDFPYNLAEIRRSPYVFTTFFLPSADNEQLPSFEGLFIAGQRDVVQFNEMSDLLEQSIPSREGLSKAFAVPEVSSTTNTRSAEQHRGLRMCVFIHYSLCASMCRTVFWL